MTVELMTEHHLEFLSLKRGYIGSSESTLVVCATSKGSDQSARMSAHTHRLIRAFASSLIIL